MNPRLAATSLRRLDDRPMDHRIESVLACVALRNEVERLQPLLDHHRRLGVERFLMVDNGSVDGSVEFLLEQDDVRLWSSSMSFRHANFGAHWFEAILSEHAATNWVVIVDADELLWFESCETRSISELCDELDASGIRAMSGALLDLYPRGPLADARPSSGLTPLASARWFDRRWCHGMVGRSGPNRDQVGLFGGVRRRLFGGDGWDYCLSKVPLLKFGSDAVLVGGQHWTNLPLAPERVAVLHFKLDARLVDLAWEELERGERITHEQEYQAYAEKLALHPDLEAFDPSESLEFGGSAQLRDLGIIGPIADPDEARHHIGALMTQAEIRLSNGDTRRAFALLERAAVVEPTAVGPLLRIAAVHRASDEPYAAAEAFGEAIARRPGDLEILTIATEDIDHRPPWTDAVEDLLRDTGQEIALITNLECRFTCTETFGFIRPLLNAPWIGVTNGVVDPMTSVAPFAQRSLQTLWDSSKFQQSLPQCRGLLTFTEQAADWLRSRSPVPVHVVPHPVIETSHQFDLDDHRHRHRDRPTLVQPGFWFTDLNSILDLPATRTPHACELSKVRCVSAELHDLAVAIARVQRKETRNRVSPRALRSTVDLGGIDTFAISEQIRTNIVFADLHGANADPTMLACIAMGTPILVPAIPGTIEHLGDDYPLLFESLDHAAELVRHESAIAEAHDRMCDVRARHSMAAFLTAVGDAITEVFRP